MKNKDGKLMKTKMFNLLLSTMLLLVSCTYEDAYKHKYRWNVKKVGESTECHNEGGTTILITAGKTLVPVYYPERTVCKTVDINVCHPYEPEKSKE